MRLDLRRTEFDGKPALITGEDHPHKGEVAICLGAKFNVKANIWQMVFKSTKTKEEFMVNGGSDIKWVVNKKR